MVSINGQFLTCINYLYSYMQFFWRCFGFLIRAVLTKSVMTPVLGVAGVGGSMAIYGVVGVVVSEITTNSISVNKIFLLYSLRFHGLKVSANVQTLLDIAEFTGCWLSDFWPLFSYIQRLSWSSSSGRSATLVASFLQVINRLVSSNIIKH